MTQAQLFPTTIVACQDWPSNAELIVDVHRLGYAPADARSIDLTYGRGTWWQKFRPSDLTVHDLHTVDGVDFRDLPHADATFDLVTFDPPYIESGSVHAGFADRYGIDDNGPATFVELWDLITGGLCEAARVVRPGGIVLVKCMPYQSGRRYRPVPMMLTAYAEALRLDLVDELVMRRPLGPDGYHAQLSARRNTSTLLVFRRRQRAPRTGTTAGTHRFTKLAAGPGA